MKKKTQDSEHEDKPARSTKKEVQVDDDHGLGTVQISVTAATPMVEDADKSFLNDIIKEEEEEDEEINLDEQKASSDQPSQNADQLKRDKQLEQEVAEAVDEILEEARIETSKRPQPKKTKTLDKTDSKDDPAIAKAAPPAQPPPAPPAPAQVAAPAAPPPPVPSAPTVVKPEPPKQPPPPPAAPAPSSDLPKAAAANVVKVDKPMRSGPPSVPPPPPPVQTASMDEDDNKFEANFEANFDDAFGESDPEPESPQPEQQQQQKSSRPEQLPKQLGGRASIPDELAPHQLERLQNLKESNA